VYPLYGRDYSRRTVGKGALSDTKYFNWVASLKLAFELHPFMSINVKSPI
jgi:hypothetical protein